MKFNFVVLFLALLIGENTFSHPQFLNQLVSQFPKVLNTTKCMTCHAGKGLNLFGQDVAKYAFDAVGKLDFSKVLNLDSNKNGIPNSQELVNGTNPGAALTHSFGQ